MTLASLFPRTLTSVVACALLGLSSYAADEGPIKIGHYGSLTGKDAAFGVATRKGVLLAIEELNAKGGVLGRQLE